MNQTTDHNGLRVWIDGRELREQAKPPKSYGYPYKGDGATAAISVPLKSPRPTSRQRAEDEARSRGDTILAWAWEGEERQDGAFQRFTAWGRKRVYFPVYYDAGIGQWVESVPRDPCEEASMVEAG